MNDAPSPPGSLRVLRAIAMDTAREAFARRLVWAIYGSTGLILAFLIYVLEIDIVTGAKATISLFGREAMNTAGSEALSTFLQEVQGAIAAFLYGISTFVAVYACAGLTPALYERGRVDLALARPVSRPWMVLGCYLGSVAMVALNVVLLIGGSYLILGWKSGFWNPGFLYAIPITCFVFSALMALEMLVSIVSESSAAATIVTFLALVFSPILAQKALAVRLLGSGAARAIWNGLHMLLPRTYELGAMILGMLRGEEIASAAPVLATAIFGAVCLTGAVVVFVRKDF